MTVHAEEFLRGLEVEARVTTERADLFVKGFVQTVFNEIQEGGRYSPGTPEDTGFARANWYGWINGDGVAPNLAMPVERIRGSLSGEARAAFQQMEETALRAKAGDVIEGGNNAHYIGYLEHGSSSQAPQGMVRLAILAGQQIADEVAAHVMGQRAA